VNLLARKSILAEQLSLRQRYMPIGSVDERHFRLYAARRGSRPRIGVTVVWLAIVLLARDLLT
jgi:hypothetical protein